jgi:hypothetical protein
MPSDGFPFAVQVVHHAVSVVSLQPTAAGRHWLCLMHPFLHAASASNLLIQSWCSIQLQAASPLEPTTVAFGVPCHTTTTNGTDHAAMTLQSTWHANNAGQQAKHRFQQLMRLRDHLGSLSRHFFTSRMQQFRLDTYQPPDSSPTFKTYTKTLETC